MRYVLLLLLAIFAAVGTAVLLREDAGYVLLAYGHWSAELSLASFILLLLIALALLWAALRLLLWLWRLPRRLRELRQRRRLLRARRSLVRGLIDMAEGRFRAGEKQLIRGARHSETPLVHYLMAARAAQKQDAHDRRDEYLHRAYEDTPNATVAVLLTQAELQIAHRQYEHAQATLHRLQELKPGHAYGLKLLSRLNLELADWDGLEALLPRLRKSTAMSGAEVEELEQRVLSERLREHAQPGRGEQLKALWQHIPRRLRHQLPLIRVYVRALLAADDADAAESIIRDTLRWQWDDELVIAYGQARGSAPGKQLARAEAWLKEHGDSAPLLLTAGRLCAAQQVWGKAQEYLEASLALAPRVDTYDALGRLFQATGQPERAMEAFRDGLELSLKGKVSRRYRRRNPRDTGSFRPLGRG